MLRQLLQNGFSDWTFTKTGLDTTYEIISDSEANILRKERNYIFRTNDPESTKNTAVYKNSIAVIYDEKYEVVDSGLQAGTTEK